MKLNIPKYQGGSTLFFTAIPNPLLALGLEQEQETSSTKKSGSLLSDSTDKEIMTHALPNDYRLFMKLVLNYEKNSSFGSAWGIDKYNLYALKSYANLIIFQLNSYNQAMTIAKDKGSLDEIATDSNGRIYVLDPKTRQLNTIEPNKFNREKMIPVTIGQLADLRANRDDLIDRTDITTTIANSVGTEEIDKFIRNILSNIKDTSTTLDMYTTLASLVGKLQAGQLSGREARALSALADIYDERGLKAIFKITDKETLSNILPAFEYILSIMPNNMKNQLVTNWVTLGGKYSDSGKHISSLILNSLEMNNKREDNLQINYESGLNKTLGNGDTPDTRKQTTLEAFFNQNVNVGNITITDPSGNGKYKFTAKGSKFPSIALDTGYGASNGQMTQVLDAGGKGMGKYLDMNKVYLGTDKRPQSALNNVYYKGSEMSNIYLPVTSTGELDWDTVAAFSAAEEEISSLNITDINKKNAIHASKGSPARYNANGEFETRYGNVAQFFFTFGYTTKDNLKNTTMYTKLDKEDRDLLNEEIKRYNKLYKTGIETGGLFDPDVLVPIFIKIKDNASVSASYYARLGDEVPEQSLEETQVYLQLNLPTTEPINGLAMNLFNILQ